MTGHKIIALDIDGVLNTGNRLTPWHRPAVDNLERIIQATDARILLSSSWRYLIYSGQMNEYGFEMMLRVAGVSGGFAGCTPRDEDVQECRWLQIQHWLRENGSISEYVILDDSPIGYGSPRWVQTDPRVGLTAADSDRAIEILKGR